MLNPSNWHADVSRLIIIIIIKMLIYVESVSDVSWLIIIIIIIIFFFFRLSLPVGLRYIYLMMYAMLKLLSFLNENWKLAFAE